MVINWLGFLLCELTLKGISKQTLLRGHLLVEVSHGCSTVTGIILQQSVAQIFSTNNDDDDNNNNNDNNNKNSNNNNNNFILINELEKVLQSHIYKFYGLIIYTGKIV